MTQVIELVATARETVGKGNARAERRNEKVPAVIYGDKKPPEAISIERKTLALHVGKKSFYTSLFDIDVAGKKHRVIPRDVQFHPVTDQPLHVDFLRVSKTTKIHVFVPLVFTNQDKSPGLKRGGSLNIVKHDIEVTCSATDIPETFEISLEGYALGSPVHLSDIALPKGVEFVAKDTGMTIASITVPSALRSKAGAAGDETAAAEAAPAEAGKDAKAAAKPADKK